MATLIFNRAYKPSRESLADDGDGVYVFTDDHEPLFLRGFRACIGQWARGAAKWEGSWYTLRRATESEIENANRIVRVTCRAAVLHEGDCDDCGYAAEQHLEGRCP
jgi:hypothetical protein